MKPIVENNNKNLVVTIYSKNQFIAGDIAALLANRFKVSCPRGAEGMTGVLDSDPDVLLLVGDETGNEDLDPSAVMAVRDSTGCRVILLGGWSAEWRRMPFAMVDDLPQIPRPGDLLRIIHEQVTTS